ncbi:MAG: hypothetical protein IJ170_00935 [Ruminococcus sp.]|nr:hypothetical protein [Ruminococcus sp.]
MSGEKRDYGGRNVPVNVAAKIMNKSPQFVRIGLQRGILPIGIAFKTSARNEQYDYYISPRLLADFTGCSITLCGEQNSIVSTKTLISSKSKEDMER